jgi:hypothetical protein
MCWKLCWFNYRPTFGASINALLLATRAHTALTKTNRLQSIQKWYEINHILTRHGQFLGYALLRAASLAGNFSGCCRCLVNYLFKHLMKQSIQFSSPSNIS